MMRFAHHQWSLRIWAFAVIVALAGGLAQGSYLESDYGDEPAVQPGSRPTVPRPVVPPPRPRPHPVPRPVPDNPLTDMVGRLSVRPGYHYRGLTVFPVELSRVTERRVYLSVEEALRRGVLRVREKGGGVVPALIVENRGREPVLMLGGELLLGGKQNRVLREDVLLPSRSGPVEVPVLCIEQGRWSGGSVRFEGHSSVAPLGVRGRAQAGRPQSEIWDGVSGYQERLSVESGTRDLQAIEDSPEVREAVMDYHENFARHCWRREQVGMVVARWGRIVGVDVFCNADMFRKHRDRLLGSYAVDCIAYELPDYRRKGPVAPGQEEAERFLRRVLRAHHGWRATPGLGRMLSVSGRGLSGAALVHGSQVLHACLFPEHVVIVPIAPPPVRVEPLPRRLPVE